VPRPASATQDSGRRLRLCALAIVAIGGGLALATTAGSARAQGTVAAAASIDTTAEAGDADAVEPRRKFVKWNEYDGPISTLRFGAGFLVDFASYSQDQDSKRQISMEPDVGLRDFRLLFKGRFKTKRPLSWTLGYMYDGADKEWRFRQTGIQVGVPELAGRFFLGRTKEGYSLVKVMVGYYGWGIERSQTLDAFIPILADGIKYMGYYPRHIFLNLGLYGDVLAESEKFAIYDNQVVARLGWQPILSEAEHKVLHIAVMGRDAKPDDGKMQMRSRPGAYLAPYFLDSGKFAADRAFTGGIEAFYRSGPWLFGTEYNWQKIDAATGEEPLFHGGDTSVVWLITGETRPYNAPGAFFEAVSPRKSVFEGGPGAWEAVLNVTYNDFDDGSFRGGKFWRLTPMVNWHLADFLRLEMVYGYGVLDRFSLKGKTQFFQARIQTCY